MAKFQDNKRNWKGYVLTGGSTHLPLHTGFPAITLEISKKTQLGKQKCTKETKKKE